MEVDPFSQIHIREIHLRSLMSTNSLVTFERQYTTKRIVVISFRSVDPSLVLYCIIIESKYTNNLLITILEML